MCETERQAKMELIEFDRFAEQDDCDKYNMLQQSACEIRALENKNKQLKEVIEEIRKIVKVEKEKMGYAVYDSCLLFIEEALDKVDKER